MNDSHINRTRPCGTRSHHVPHPWDNGRRWCKGWGKYAEDAQPAPIAPAGTPCTATYTGPTGIIWDCIGEAHYSDPNRGYAGSGHTMRARPRRP